MVLTCKFLKKISNIFTRPVFPGLFLLYTFIAPNNLKADYYPTVVNIEVIGLDRTKQYIVDREILHPLNSQIDSTLADLDRNRIFNLGLFDNVAWRLVPLENGDAKLQFIMIESINRTPPLIFPSYDEEKGWSLNGLLILKNFQGKNRSVELNTSFGGEKKIQLLFNDPWLFGDHISLSTYIENNSYEHLFLDQNINVNNIRMSIGKWYGENIKLRFSPTITQKVYANRLDTLEYSYFIPELKFEFDTRDIFWNPKKGFRIIQSFIPMLGENEFHIWNQSFSLFLPYSKTVTLALNTTIQKKYGYKNDVWINYFGNSFNIRGWKLPKKGSSLDNFRFGHEFIFSSFEVRKIVLSDKESVLGLSKGLCFVGFIDGGVINKNWDDINMDNLIGGAGIGVRIPVPILQSVRIDIGWGIKNKMFNKNYAVHLAIQQKF